MSKASWILALSGVGVAVLGVAAYAEHQKQSKANLGRIRRSPSLLGRTAKLGKRPRMVGETKAGGMKLQHFRTEGDMSIEDRVRLIQDNVWKSIQDPRMRKIALDITKKCPERDGECEAREIYKAVKKRVRYTGDVGPVKMGSAGPTEAVDFFQSAYRTWEIGGGDCDDSSTLTATLLALNGLDAQLRVTSESKASEWSHVYAVFALPKGTTDEWFGIDTTLPGTGHFKREHPYAKKLDFAI